MGALSLGVTLAEAADPPPLRVRTAGTNAHRLVEDATGKPFFVAGWAPQNIVHTLAPTQFDAYFQTMHAKGFNTAWVLASGWKRRSYDANPDWNPQDLAGHYLQKVCAAPYGDLSAVNLNPDYVASVDALVDAAGRNGVYLFFNLMNEPGQQFASRGQAECVSWGRFWGDRYAARTHVNFMLGNDSMPQPQANWVVSGARQSCPDRLFVADVISMNGPAVTTQTPNPMREILGPNKSTWINLHAWYAYEDMSIDWGQVGHQYATYRMYTQTYVAPAPTFTLETEYAQWHVNGTTNDPGQGYGTTPVDYAKLGGKPGFWTLRRQIWSQPLGGASGFGILGSWDEWWDNPAKFTGNPFWTYASHCTAFFAARAWGNLVPDYSHVFLTSQTTNPAPTDYTYVSAALATDGSFGTIYFPGLSGQGRDLTVNMAKLGGGVRTTTVRWLDPTNNTYTTISGSPFANTGSQVFTAPATNSAGVGDWVLVLEANSVPVNHAPTITTQPVGRTVTVGSPATFSVVASGTPAPTCQWRKGGVNLAGATGASYTTPATVQADNGAVFSVVVSNSAGSVTSANATLTVNAVVGNALVAHWKLDEAAGPSSHDASPSGITGTWENGPSFTTAHPDAIPADAGSLSFNGVNQDVNMGNPATLPTGLAARTICGWAKTSSTAGGWGWIASYGSTGASQAMFIGRNGTTLYGGGYGDDLTVANFWDGNWHLIALTYDGTTASLYADGKLLKSATKTWNLVPGGCFIGKQVNGGEYWNGLIDDVRIYNYALSADQIADLAQGLMGVFIDDDSVIAGGSRVLGTAVGTAVASQSALPFAAASGSYLHAVVYAGTTGRPILAAYTPATTANAWTAMVGTTADGVHLTLNGGYDLFVRPMGPAGMLTDMSWFRPVDVAGPGGLRLIFGGRGSATQSRLSMEIKSTAALGLGSSPGSFTTNNLYKMPPNQIIDFSSPIFAIGAVSHVGFTFSTDASTGQITVKLFGCAGGGAIDTTSTANLLASQSFYASAAAFGANPLPAGAWNMVTVSSATCATSADYDSIRLFNNAPVEFPALPGTAPVQPSAGG